jgi:hypothetical protein
MDSSNTPEVHVVVEKNPIDYPNLWDKYDVPSYTKAADKHSKDYLGGMMEISSDGAFYSGSDSSKTKTS